MDPVDRSAARADNGCVDYDVETARTDLSKLLARAHAGEEVVLTANGLPVAKLVPVRISRDREPGLEQGRIWIADDFDAPLPDELLDAFEGRS